MSNLRLLIIRHEEYYMINNYELVMSKRYSLSNKLRYVQWTGYPFKYLPSSFHPAELVELILVRSCIEQLWKNKSLPNLRRLDLSDSKMLEKIVDFGQFPNLEWLNLERCIKLVELDSSIGLLRKLVHLNLGRCIILVKLDPSIELLRKLVYLNLEGCYNLVSIPNNIFCLSSLEYLNMWGCSKVFNSSWIMLPAPTRNTYVLPSLHRLCCLREVDISFCNLNQVPDSIECLQWLEMLNLEGNNFVTLPSLRNLSKLEYLNLAHCKLLESLPQLPSPTTIGRVQPNYSRRGLFIFNCPKLGERERCCSMTLSWMIQFVQVYQQPYMVQMVTPGSEIPSLINNLSMGGSISVDRPPIMHDNNNNIIGLVCCAVFSMALSPPPDARLVCKFKHIYSDRTDFNFIFPLNLDGDLVTNNSSHLWILYFPGKYYNGFDIIWGDGFGIKVKSCRYGWVCKQDLQEFNLTMMNHEKSLASKCKILAIEDETQPQPQSEQESFTSQVITTSQRIKSTSDNKSNAKTISVVNGKQRNKSRTSISATETDVSAEAPDSPVADEVSTESQQKKISNLHIIGRFLSNCCQQGSTDTDTDIRYDTDTVNSDAESLVSEEDLDAVNNY